MTPICAESAIELHAIDQPSFLHLHLTSHSFNFVTRVGGVYLRFLV